MSLLKSTLVCAAFVTCASVNAGEDTSITDSAKIQALLASIPATGKDLGLMTLADRLASLGVKVTYVNFGKFEPDEVAASGGALRAGDVDYMLNTTEPDAALAGQCAVISSFNLQKRGKTWLPESRTANYYLHGVCKAP